MIRLRALLAATPAVAVRQLLGGDDRGITAAETGQDRSDPAIDDLTFDSRRVGPGTLFCCLRGDRHDGHDFAATALAAGAAALLTDHQLALPGAVQIVVDDTRTAMAHLAATIFGWPSERLDVVGITGTNGKTTTAHILAAALGALGVRTGVVGTLTDAHTTPEAPDLQRRLASFVEDGCAAVAMEVSSHALALSRVMGTHFRVGVFTNLGRDHLDLHGTEERYFAAKARLFEAGRSDHGVVNVDDVHGRLLVDSAEIPMSTFSMADATSISVGPAHHRFTWRGEAVQVGLGGRFNVANSLAAATTLAVLGHAPAEIATALGAATVVPGRFEPIDAGQPFAVVVDYAHTPDALAGVLVAARELAGAGRVHVVFGCGGDRDAGKRAAMGRVATELADHVVVTSDNPRSEDPSRIVENIVAGFVANYRGSIEVEPDRQRAIALVVRDAGRGDVVVVAGKGHEITQTAGAVTTPFDDRAVTRALLQIDRDGGRS